MKSSRPALKMLMQQSVGRVRSQSRLVALGDPSHDPCPCADHPGRGPETEPVSSQSLALFDEVLIALNIAHKGYPDLAAPLDFDQRAPVGFLGASSG